MELVFETVIACPVEQVFRFHESPGHLSVLMHDWKTFRLLHHEDSIKPGSTLWFEETIANCMPVVLGFRHVEYEPPYMFREKLIHGPFRRFDHIHEFEDTDGGTLVRDRFDIALPMKYGGAWADRIFIASRMGDAFAYRHRMLRNIAISGGMSTKPTTEND